MYARPLEMFLSEVDHDKYPEVTQKMRFEPVDRKSLQHTAPGCTATFPQTEKVIDEIVLPKAAGLSKKEDVCTPEAAANYSDEVLEQVAPGVLQFLDADTHEQRLEILVSLVHEIDDHMLNTMAVAMDVELSSESLEDRYEELKNCLITMEKYERNRLY